MKRTNPITTPALTVAEHAHNLAAGPVFPAETISKLEGAFDVLRHRDTCPRMRATYEADLLRMKALYKATVEGETATERTRAREALRTLADDYRAMAQDHPDDDAEQDALLASIVARAFMERGLASSAGTA